MAARQRKPVDTETYEGRFAVRLKQLREKKKLTVDELAEISGIPKKSIYNWESTMRSPSIGNLPLLAKALGVKARTLLPDE